MQRAADAGLQRAADRWQTPYPWLTGLRVWSPVIVPPVLGLLLFFFIALPAAQYSTGQVTSLIWQSPIVLLLVYFDVGALYGLALHFAPSLNSWAKVLLGGVVLNSLVALWLSGNMQLFILIVLVWSVLGFLYLRTSRYEVPTDTLSHTTFGRHYWRTVTTGRIWLLPGERIRAQVPNPLRHYVVPRQQVRLRAPTGEDFNVEVNVIVSYRQLPTDALHTQTPLADRKAYLHQLVNEKAKNLLASYGNAALRKRMIGPHTPQPIKGHKLARTLLAQLRRNARSEHLAIRTVRIHHLQLIYCPSSGRLWHLQPASSSADHEEPVQTGQHGRYYDEDYADYAVDASEREAVEQDRILALPPETLLGLYQAVCDRTITDTTTIRAIAQEIHAVAQNQDWDNDYPYDLEAMARRLFKYSATLDRGRASLRQQ